MSRSAEVRQLQQAWASGTVDADPYAVVGDFDAQIARGVLPMIGSDRTFNLNELLAANIVQSAYFKSLAVYTTFQEVLNEIKAHVDHVEPWSAGTQRVPSTAFCILFKLCTLHATTNQMTRMLNAPGAPHVRAIGFLFLRFTAPFADLWGWFEPHIDDDEEFGAAASGDKT
jgi:pre-mRNA-splicing factor 38B